MAFKKKRLTAIEHLLRGAGTGEISLGSPTQNRDYCTKDDGRIGDFSEIGTLPAGQGSRTDLVGLHSALKDGLTQADYANEYFSKFIQYPNLVQNYVVSTIEARDPSKPFSSWLLIGPAGTGKSRLARELGRRIGNGLLPTLSRKVVRRIQRRTNCPTRRFLRIFTLFHAI